MRLSCALVCSLLLIALPACDPFQETVFNDLQFRPKMLVPEQCSQDSVLLLDAYGTVLANYITDDGAIDIDGLLADDKAQRDLDCFLGAMNEELDDPAPSAGADQQIANWINWRNAAVLRSVVEAYGFFESPEGPDRVILRASLEREAPPAAEDWRLPFALGGAGRDGPAISNLPYTAEDLDGQLDRALKDYIGSCAGLQVDHARQRVLFGRLIYRRKEWFIGSYHLKHGVTVSLITAVTPFAWPQTQQQLADLVGYTAAELEADDTLNLAPGQANDREVNDEPQDDTPPICGRK